MIPLLIAGGINVNDLGVTDWQPAFKQINQIQVAGGYFTIGDNPQALFVRKVSKSAVLFTPMLWKLS